MRKDREVIVISDLHLGAGDLNDFDKELGNCLPESPHQASLQKFKEQRWRT